MYFELEGSSVRLGGTMHCVPMGRPLARWVHDAISSYTWSMRNRNQTGVDTRRQVRSASRTDCRTRGLASSESIRSIAFVWNTFRG